MYNWSVKPDKTKKDAYEIWQLEQAINFGLNGKKINKKKLIFYWDKLDLDPAKKSYLASVLWEK